MIFKEIKKDLFDVDFNTYTPAHCISTDCKMGAGIAVPMRKKFNLGGMGNIDYEIRKHPTCIYHNGVLNLITKEKYWHKPTYKSLEISLTKMGECIKMNNIEYVVMPTIGSGLDRLSWPVVRGYIKEILKDLDVEILICKK